MKKPFTRREQQQWRPRGLVIGRGGGGGVTKGEAENETDGGEGLMPKEKNVKIMVVNDNKGKEKV